MSIYVGQDLMSPRAQQVVSELVLREISKRTQLSLYLCAIEKASENFSQSPLRHREEKNPCNHRICEKPSEGESIYSCCADLKTESVCKISAKIHDRNSSSSQYSTGSVEPATPVGCGSGVGSWRHTEMGSRIVFAPTHESGWRGTSILPISQCKYWRFAWYVVRLQAAAELKGLADTNGGRDLCSDGTAVACNDDEEEEEDKEGILHKSSCSAAIQQWQE